METIKVPTDWQWVAESDPKAIAALIDRLTDAIEDAVDTLEAMDMHTENPLYDRLRATLEMP